MFLLRRCCRGQEKKDGCSEDDAVTLMGGNDDTWNEGFDDTGWDEEESITIAIDDGNPRSRSSVSLSSFSSSLSPSSSSSSSSTTSTSSSSPSSSHAITDGEKMALPPVTARGSGHTHQRNIMEETNILSSSNSEEMDRSTDTAQKKNTDEIENNHLNVGKITLTIETDNKDQPAHSQQQQQQQQHHGQQQQLHHHQQQHSQKEKPQPTRQEVDIFESMGISMTKVQRTKRKRTKKKTPVVESTVTYSGRFDVDSLMSDTGKGNKSTIVTLDDYAPEDLQTNGWDDDGEEDEQGAAELDASEEGVSGWGDIDDFPAIPKATREKKPPKHSILLSKEQNDDANDDGAAEEFADLGF